MRHFCFLLWLLVAFVGRVSAQSTFKAGFKTYNTGLIIHEYGYKYVQKDGPQLYATDSAKTYVNTDSFVTMTVAHRQHDQAEYKTINYLTTKKLLAKSEEYKNGNLVEENSWKYDDKRREIYHLKENKTNGYTYKKNFRYENEKGGGHVKYESSYFNGRIEFYTKYYFNSKNVLTKEVRLNDNNKDIVHVETYTYGENGKVKERSVYFPEFKVTKTFKEPEGNVPAKCSGMMPIGIKAKANPATRTFYIKRAILKNLATISDPECSDFDYTFTNYSDCLVKVASTKINNGRVATFVYKEKI